MPLFLILSEGKLLVKREARLKEVVASFRITSKSQVAVIDGYAGPAFQVDKEVHQPKSTSVRLGYVNPCSRTTPGRAVWSVGALNEPAQVLIVANEAVRSNWIVALRSAMLATETPNGQKHQPVELVEPVTATMRSRLLGRPAGACDGDSDRIGRRACWWSGRPAGG